MIGVWIFTLVYKYRNICRLIKPQFWGFCKPPNTIKVLGLTKCVGEFWGVVWSVISHFIFQNSSIIVPIPKNTNARPVNYFRPIALTSLLMKCLERIIKPRIIEYRYSSLESSSQFAYRRHRSVEDATLTVKFHIQMWILVRLMLVCCL